MIDRFGDDTALLVIDVQAGVDDLVYYGGPDGRRNNPDAEQHMLDLLAAWRAHGLPVFFSLHDSREQGSPLKLSLPTGASKPGFEPRPGDGVVTKDVNSAFIGTDLVIQLRRAGIGRVAIVGFYTNMCVETTAREAADRGYQVTMVEDSCATTRKELHEGTMQNFQRLFGRVRSTDEVMSELSL